MVPNFYVFHSEDFSCAGESNEGGNHCPSRYSLLRQKFYRRGDEVKKIKSSVHGEISKCALIHCFATSLRRKRPILHKSLKSNRFYGVGFFFFKLINSKRKYAENSCADLGGKNKKNPKSRLPHSCGMPLFESGR